MKHRAATAAQTIILAVSLFLLPTKLAAASDPDSWKWNDPKDLKVPGLRHGTIQSPSMKRTVGFNIYLPPHYEQEPTRRFPVVYFLHGSGGTESSDAGLARPVHAEVVSGRIEPVIYVFPNGGASSGYRDWTNGNVKSETLLIQELLPHIDREFRTVNQATARGLCGFSMGGGGAIRLTLKYPELFGAAAALAAALEQSDTESGGDNCYRYATALTKEQRDRLRLYFVVGEDDFLFPRHAPYLKHLKELGLGYTLVTHSKLGHNLGVLNELSGQAMIHHLNREMRPPARPSDGK